MVFLKDFPKPVSLSLATSVAALLSTPQPLLRDLTKFVKVSNVFPVSTAL